jgi:hypothetical protein
VIRKVSATGEVTTLAGAGNGPEYPVDGQGAAATFGPLTALTMLSGGDLIVAESDSALGTRLRRITPAGVVTTETLPPEVVFPRSILIDGLASNAAGELFLSDPNNRRLIKLSGGTATFISVQDDFVPGKIALSSDGRLFANETRARGLRTGKMVAQIGAAGQVEIILGQRNVSGHKDGVGADAIAANLTGIAVDATGALYLTSEFNTLRKGVLASAPQILVQPQSQNVAAGASVQFSVSAAGVPAPTYLWHRNGVPISGATSSTFSIANVQAADVASYNVLVSSPLSIVSSNAASLTIAAANTGGGGETPAPGTGGGNASGGSGGGGAPSHWFVGALALLACVRWYKKRFF